MYITKAVTQFVRSLGEGICLVAAVVKRAPWLDCASNPKNLTVTAIKAMLPPWLTLVSCTLIPLHGLMLIVWRQSTSGINNRVRFG